MSTQLKRITIFTVILTLCIMLMAAFSTTETYAASKTHLKKNSITMTIGGSYQQSLLTASDNKISSSKITWSSNNNKVARVSKAGKITAVAKGTTTLKAKYNGKTYSFKVKVKKCTIVPLDKCVVGGEAQMCMYNAADNKINAEKVKWSSSNKEILTVNSKGVITGLSTGTATVYGTYLNHKYSREVSVEWCELDNISITVPYPQDKGLINFNYTTNYPNGIKVELGAGSELVKVFHQNLGNGDNRHASVYCYPNATGQVELKVRTLSEPDAYFSYKLNFRKGKFIGVGDMKSEEAQNSSSKSTLPPPTYSEAGIMNLGYMTDNLQIAIEDSIADNTMSYLYKFYGTDIEAMAIIATYRDYLLDNGWRFHKSESNDAGGVTHALYNSNYLVGLSCDPIYENDGSVAYYAISVTILRRS